MNQAPTWQRELANFAGIKPVFVVEGNVDDIYPWRDGGGGTARVVEAADPADAGASVDALATEASVLASAVDDTLFLTMDEVLARMFERGAGAPYVFLFCDPLRGITDPLQTGHARDLAQAAEKEARALAQEAESLNPAADPAARQQPFDQNRLTHDSLLIRAALSRRLDLSALGPDQPSVACVLNLASRLSSAPEDLTPEENAVFLNLLIGAEQAIRGDGRHINTLVLVVRRAGDLPSWFVRDNARVRVISVPNPDRPARESFIDQAFPDLAAPELDRVRTKFVDTTDAMLLRELDELRRLYARGETPPERISELVDLYKYGIRENQWAALADKLRERPEEALRARVKGQDAAIDDIVSVLKRSVLGFSGMQHSSGSKPKGVLFLAGPTGTGKTEMVKAVTELLFGDERSYLRFDMSEYAAENSDQRLFGAPPGYVGYEQGGQLTNAVRANPFRVLLFDEVEKAHPSIMDKFLQILEDGRMTDGQGQTVYFSETIIFFTSNVGISEEVLDQHGRVVGRRNAVEPGQPYAVIQEKVRAAMATHFKPEVLGRIGDNIVVFDFISPEATELILVSQLRKINGNVRSQLGIDVVVDETASRWLLDRALGDDVREKGGRGIGNLVESAYLNPLASFVFDGGVSAGRTVHVRKAAEGEGLRFEAEPASASAPEVR